MKTPELTLYIDGNCPLCVAEWNRLREWDRHGRLAFVDIAQPGFDPAPLGVELTELNRQLHGWTASGECVVGIDSMIAAYTLAGRGWVVAPLRIAVLRPAYRAAYRAFARNRMRISAWFGLRRAPVCTDGVCAARSDPFR
ncbi:DCC1-like thiol-disulfide oxidoreductase family protein [Paraburkholderia sp. D15]|uniref:thiol-disulfide oxidoreductase DCC family protein n=1 Tax=Paraburkholderia sp. D15 TaxID=2880218 RepID=UPI00247962D2|nr:DCC1-like thiol-disulfide oxidoreductase family protein [Paraburkholderia sp. D15]WGS52775.1 DCC1-like thiol-disulfide oxidoreductase family protein [Paraburkholderia sp. D15]